MYTAIQSENRELETCCKGWITVVIGFFSAGLRHKSIQVILQSFGSEISVKISPAPSINVKLNVKIVFMKMLQFLLSPVSLTHTPEIPYLPLWFVSYAQVANGLLFSIFSLPSPIPTSIFYFSHLLLHFHFLTPLSFVTTPLLSLSLFLLYIYNSSFYLKPLPFYLFSQYTGICLFCMSVYLFLTYFLSVCIFLSLSLHSSLSVNGTTSLFPQH